MCSSSKAASWFDSAIFAAPQAIFDVQAAHGGESSGVSRLAGRGGSAHAGAHSRVAVRQRVALPLEVARRLVRLRELGLVVAHGGLQLCRLALEALGSFPALP